MSVVAILIHLVCFFLLLFDFFYLWLHLLSFILRVSVNVFISSVGIEIKCASGFLLVGRLCGKFEFPFLA